nr:DNA/RNA nuclease SfsA [Oceanobacillus senegalensis]
MKASQYGYNAAILFVLQMKGCHAFSPNIKMDRNFTDSLLKASRQGIQILAYDSIVKRDGLTLNQPVPVII